MLITFYKTINANNIIDMKQQAKRKIKFQYKLCITNK